MTRLFKGNLEESSAAEVRKERDVRDRELTADPVPTSESRSRPWERLVVGLRSAPGRPEGPTREGVTRPPIRKCDTGNDDDATNVVGTGSGDGGWRLVSRRLQ